MSSQNKNFYVQTRAKLAFCAIIFLLISYYCDVVNEYCQVFLMSFNFFWFSLISPIFPFIYFFQFVIFFISFCFIFFMFILFIFLMCLLKGVVFMCLYSKMPSWVAPSVFLMHFLCVCACLSIYVCLCMSVYLCVFVYVCVSMCVLYVYFYKPVFSCF